jgi:hypothetical protein
MTQDITGIANKASREWLKELPSPEETSNQVPKRFLEIFAKLIATEEHMKLYGYVWTKNNHSPMFFWTERGARDVQRDFGGEVVAVYK